MRVSLINVNLMAEDATGTAIINQVRFFQGRCDDTVVYVQGHSRTLHPDVQAVTRAVTLRGLLEGREEHFRLSDLFIYHYPGYYSLLESIRGIDRGRAWSSTIRKVTGQTSMKAFECAHCNSITLRRWRIGQQSCRWQ